MPLLGINQPPAINPYRWRDPRIVLLLRSLETEVGLLRYSFTTPENVLKSFLTNVQRHSIKIKYNYPKHPCAVATAGNSLRSKSKNTLIGTKKIVFLVGVISRYYESENMPWCCGFSSDSLRNTIICVRWVECWKLFLLFSHDLYNCNKPFARA